MKASPIEMHYKINSINFIAHYKIKGQRERDERNDQILNCQAWYLESGSLAGKL